NDGRVVHLGGFPQEIGGHQPIDAIHARGVEVLDSQSGNQVHTGTVHLGKKLRPNRRNGRTVLFVSRSQQPDEENHYTALKLR
ncbi:MAG: hypothetical protein KDA79_13380, partial [Planctomycetaceae bacterium]|nr:hypothetical protein [Planctomycetaceae bacterium]